MTKHISVIVNDASIWIDGEVHTLEEWESILKEKQVDVKSVRPFGLTEENFHED